MHIELQTGLQGLLLSWLYRGLESGLHSGLYSRPHTARHGLLGLHGLVRNGRHSELHSGLLFRKQIYDNNGLRRERRLELSSGRPGSLYAGLPSGFPQFRADRFRPDFRNGDKDAEHVHAACVSADQTGFAALLDELRRDLGN